MLHVQPFTCSQVGPTLFYVVKVSLLPHFPQVPTLSKSRPSSSDADSNVSNVLVFVGMKLHTFIVSRSCTLGWDTLSSNYCVARVLLPVSFFSIVCCSLGAAGAAADEKVPLGTDALFRTYLVHMPVALVLAAVYMLPSVLFAVWLVSTFDRGTSVRVEEWYGAVRVSGRTNH